MTTGCLHRLIGSAIVRLVPMGGDLVQVDWEQLKMQHGQGGKGKL